MPEYHGRTHKPGGTDPIPGLGSVIDFCAAISTTASVSTATNGVIGFDDDLSITTNSSVFSYDATNDAINIDDYGVFLYSLDVALYTTGTPDDSPTTAFLYPQILDATAAASGAYYWPILSQPRLPSALDAEVGAFVTSNGENGDMPRARMIVSLQDDGFTTLPFKLKARLITTAPAGTYSRTLTGSVYRLGDAALFA